MEAEEAIRGLRFLLSYEEIGKYSREVFETAIEALEKQIPKKPDFVDIRFRNHGRNISDGCSLSKCYKCPNCNLHIFNVFNEECCNHCGQAIDWRVEESKDGIVTF